MIKVACTEYFLLNWGEIVILKFVNKNIQEKIQFCTYFISTLYFLCFQNDDKNYFLF